MKRSEPTETAAHLHNTESIIFLTAVTSSEGEKKKATLPEACESAQYVPADVCILHIMQMRFSAMSAGRTVRHIHNLQHYKWKRSPLSSQ